tara:strand:- start:770 stop:1723 length:954 start_codon:yes stop_codon:yes gene_type:complete
MPLRVIKRGDWYHVHGAHHGVDVRRSAKTTDKREAEAVKERIEREIYARVILGQSRPVGFSEAAAGYLEHGEDRFIVPVIDAFKDRPVADIRQPDLDTAAREAYPKHTPATRNRQFYTPFIAIMNFAARQGWCDRREWMRPKQPDGRTDWRTPEEMEEFILRAPWHISRNVIIYLGSMMRASEGVKLQSTDVAGDGSQITLWETKGGYARRVEILSRARPLISEASGPVIRTDDGKGYHAYDAVNQSIARACEALGLPHFSLHVLRHTGATWRYAMDPDLPRLMASGGWRSMAMVQRYTHVATRDLPERLEHHGWAL